MMKKTLEEKAKEEKMLLRVLKYQPVDEDIMMTGDEVDTIEVGSDDIITEDGNVIKASGSPTPYFEEK